MKNTMRFTHLLVFSVCSIILYGLAGCKQVPPASELFEQAWSDFDQTYSYFSYKNVDWDAVKTQYAPQFTDDLSADEFAVTLNNMLQVLHDWHVAVQKPGGEWIGYNGSIETNYPAKLAAQYTRDGEYTNLGDGVIYHAWLSDNIAYIDVETLDTNSFKSVSDQDIENLFQTYQSADGMIIDIRANSGGNEANAEKFASRFTDRTRTFGYVKYRQGSGHDDFGELIEKTLEPSSGTRFSKKAVCLIGQRVMSSGEWFTLMMKACPTVTLIGDTTRGASGSPKDFSLANGVSYSVCTWMAYTYDNTVIEDNGIAPDIAVSPQASYDDSHDYVLERAISYLTGKSTTTTAPASTTTTVPAAPATTTTTAAAVSDSPVISSFTVSPATGQAWVDTFTFTCSASDPDGIAGYWWDIDGDSGGNVNLSWYFDMETVENTLTVPDEMGLINYWYAGTYTAYVVAWDIYNNYAVASVNVTVTE